MAMARVRSQIAPASLDPLHSPLPPLEALQIRQLPSRPRYTESKLQHAGCDASFTVVKSPAQQPTRLAKSSVRGEEKRQSSSTET